MTHVMPASGVITQYFGCTGNPYEPAYGNCSHFHPGLDIANVYGTTLRASAGGTVVAANWNGNATIGGVTAAWGFGGGNNVIIQHNTSFWTIYAHMLSFAVERGQHVAGGQIIGAMDTTGTATGPHVHWGAWYKSLWFDRGVPINPLRLIAGGDLANSAAYNPTSPVTYVYLNADGVRVRNQPTTSSTKVSGGSKDQRFVYGGTINSTLPGGTYTVNVNGVPKTSNSWVKVWFNNAWWYSARLLVHF